MNFSKKILKIAWDWDKMLAEIPKIVCPVCYKNQNLKFCEISDFHFVKVLLQNHKTCKSASRTVKKLQ